MGLLREIDHVLRDDLPKKRCAICHDTFHQARRSIRGIVGIGEDPGCVSSELP